MGDELEKKHDTSHHHQHPPIPATEKKEIKIIWRDLNKH